MTKKITSLVLLPLIAASVGIPQHTFARTGEEVLAQEAVKVDPLTDQKPELKKVNTLIIISDQHNPKYSSPYGHPFVKTPNMQWLADNGTTFENAYTPCPICLPTRSSFLTGLRVHETQCYENTTLGHRHDFPNYGSVLNGQGVHTAYIARIDGYNYGVNLGFNEAIRPGDRNTFRKDPNYENQAHTLIRIPLHQGKSKPIKFGIQEKDNLDLQATELAIDWLENKSPGIDKPWVATVGLFQPHEPHMTTQEYWDMYEGMEDLPPYGQEEDTAKHPYVLDQKLHYNTANYTDDIIKGNRRAYYARVTNLDYRVGQIINALRKSGQLENTNIIYTSDHGEMLGKFGLWKKNNHLDDSVKIPMIAMGPDFKKGARIKTPVDLHDLQASTFKAANAIRPSYWVGTPLQDIPENDKERVVFSEYYGHGVRASSFMIRKGDWKLIYVFNAPHMLFNLAVDPEELNNVYEKEPEKAAELEAELRKICDPELENERSFKLMGDTFVPGWTEPNGNEPDIDEPEE